MASISNPLQRLKSLVTDPVFPLLMVNFIGTLGYGIILPFLAFLVIDFGGNEVIYGFIAATYPFFQMIGAPLLGNWSDRIGRKRVLFISQAGTLLSWIIFLIAFYLPTTELFSADIQNVGMVVMTLPLVVVIAARSLDGLTGGNISVANAYLSDITEEKDRKKNFGRMSASQSLGFILGPATAGLLSGLPSGKLITVIVTAVISVIGLLIIYFYLPDIQGEREERERENERENERERENEKERENDDGKYDWRKVIQQNGAIMMISLFFFIYIAFNLFYATFSMHSSTTLNWTEERLGFFFTLLSGVMIVVQGPVLSRLSDRYSDRALFMAGSLIMSVTFLCFSSTNVWILYAGAVFFGMGNGIMWPSFLAVLSKVGERKRQGGLQGIANGAGSLASILGLIIGGVLLSVMSSQLYLISSGLFILIAISGFRMPNR